MIKGKTQTGFEFQIDEDHLNDYELFDMLSSVEEDPMVVPKLINKLLGKDQKKALMDHLRTDKGVVPIQAMTDAVTEIFQSSQSTKNS